MTRFAGRGPDGVDSGRKDDIASEFVEMVTSDAMIKGGGEEERMG
jgi:hypothetical protein